MTVSSTPYFYSRGWWSDKVRAAVTPRHAPRLATTARSRGHARTPGRQVWTPPPGGPCKRVAATGRIGPMAIVEPPARSVEPPARSVKTHAPWRAVALAVGLPGIYLGYWHATVRADLERHRLHWARTVGWTLAGTAGWVLIVPAAVQIVHTARRVQRCEASRLGAAQPVGRVLGLLAAAELLGVALALGGAPGLVPVCVLLAGAAEVGMLHPRVNALRAAADGTPSPAGAPQAPVVLPILPPRARSLARTLTRWSEDLEAVVWFAGLTASAALLAPLVYALAPVARTGPPAGVVTAVLLCGLLIGMSLGLG